MSQILPVEFYSWLSIMLYKWVLLCALSLRMVQYYKEISKWWGAAFNLIQNVAHETKPTI